MFDLLLFFITFLCWGSFLNVVAYRTTFDKPFFTMRSFCPSCKKTIAWYDNLPLVSYVLLRGKCRYCKAKISWLYPFIEFLSGVLCTSLLFTQALPWPFISYFIFISALLVATRTDLEALVIPQIFSLWLVPLGIFLSYFDATDITFYESILGAILGYGLLWIVAKIFMYLMKKDGLGIGDMELMALIGAFLGPLGVWFALLLGSLSGLLVGGGYLLLVKKDRNTRIPFGPFLALGAAIYLFFDDVLFKILLG